jgi:hypothetical protein
MTLTKAKVFSWLREAVSSRSQFFGELFSCPYCMSHWLAFIGVLVFRPALAICPVPYLGPVAEVALSTFVVVALNAPIARLIFSAYAAMGALAEEEEE